MLVGGVAWAPARIYAKRYKGKGTLNDKPLKETRKSP
jgi:hypothetical protein